MKKLFIAMIVLVICVLMAGCSQPEPTTTSSPTPTHTPTPTPTPTLTTPSPTPTPSTTPTTITMPEILVEGLVFPECPRWHDGKLWFSDMHAHKVMTVDMEGNTEVIVEVPGQPGGLGWLPDGRLLVVSMTDKKLLRLDPDGLTEVADLSGLAGGDLNDMVVDALGRAYVGDAEKITMVAPEGNMSIMSSGMIFPNGSVITPDGNTLIVAESFGGCLTAFDIEPDGSLWGRRVWAKLPAGVYPDGICLDAEGAVWLANAGGTEVIRVLEGGEVTDRIKMSQNTYACALGGPDGRTLFICTAETFDPDAARAKASARIETAKVEVPGAVPPAAPTASTEPASGFKVSGTLEQTEMVIDSQEVIGVKTVSKDTIYFDYHGTLEGKVVIKWDMEVGMVDGKITITGEGTFTGTVNGKEGTFTFTESSTGQMFSQTSGVANARYTIVSGTGELSDLQGVINAGWSFDTTTNVGRGTYSGTLRFEE